MKPLTAFGRLFLRRSPQTFFSRALNQSAEPVNEISSALRQYLDKSRALFSEEFTRLSTVVASSDRPGGFRESLDKWTNLKLLMNLNERLLDLQALDADSIKLLEELDDGSDSGLQDLVSQEHSARQSEAKSIEGQILSLLLPPDPYADCSAVRLQLIAGAGGQEAGLFARDLFSAYAAFVRQRGWLIDPGSSPLPGEDNASPVHSLEVRVSAPSEGDTGVYRLLRWEAGVHRVQRVPITSKLNKIHTSTVAVTILPEIDGADVEISPDDLEWEVFRSSGAGGQHVNKTESAVRLRHRPSGHVVACQAERSQHANRQIALRLLKAKLVGEATQQKVESDLAKRRAQMGSLERSDRIRTYNYQQDRITDHRLGRSWSGLASYMRQGTPVLEEAAEALEEAFTLNALKTLEKPHFLT